MKKRRVSDLSQQDIDNICQLYQMRVTKADIARYYDLYPVHVSNFITARGIQQFSMDEVKDIITGIIVPTQTREVVSHVSN